MNWKSLLLTIAVLASIGLIASVVIFPIVINTVFPEYASSTSTILTGTNEVFIVKEGFVLGGDGARCWEVFTSTNESKGKACSGEGGPTTSTCLDIFPRPEGRPSPDDVWLKPLSNELFGTYADCLK